MNKHIKLGLIVTSSTAVALFLIISIINLLGGYTFFLLYAVILFAVVALISYYIDKSVDEELQQIIEEYSYANEGKTDPEAK